MRTIQPQESSTTSTTRRDGQVMARTSLDSATGIAKRSGGNEGFAGFGIFGTSVQLIIPEPQLVDGRAFGNAYFRPLHRRHPRLGGAPRGPLALSRDGVNSAACRLGRPGMVHASAARSSPIRKGRRTFWPPLARAFQHFASSDSLVRPMPSSCAGRPHS
jgi:hypothetical protein